MAATVTVSVVAGRPRAYGVALAAGAAGQAGKDARRHKSDDHGEEWSIRQVMARTSSKSWRTISVCSAFTVPAACFGAETADARRLGTAIAFASFDGGAVVAAGVPPATME